MKIGDCEFCYLGAAERVWESVGNVQRFQIGGRHNALNRIAWFSPDKRPSRKRSASFPWFSESIGLFIAIEKDWRQGRQLAAGASVLHALLQTMMSHGLGRTPRLWRSPKLVSRPWDIGPSGTSASYQVIDRVLAPASSPSCPLHHRLSLPTQRRRPARLGHASE